MTLAVLQGAATTMDAADIPLLGPFFARASVAGVDGERFKAFDALAKARAGAGACAYLRGTAISLLAANLVREAELCLKASTFDEARDAARAVTSAVRSFLKRSPMKGRFADARDASAEASVIVRVCNELVYGRKAKLVGFDLGRALGDVSWGDNMPIIEALNAMLDIPISPRTAP
jgi:hypothetical protein